MYLQMTDPIVALKDTKTLTDAVKRSLSQSLSVMVAWAPGRPPAAGGALASGAPASVEAAGAACSGVLGAEARAGGV